MQIKRIGHELSHDPFRRHVTLVLVSLLWCLQARAVTFVNSGDPQRNTAAPGAALAGSGWDLQGEWGSFLGTTVAPGYFITAKHVGGNVGQSFIFRGVSYPTTARFDDPESDLTLWRVAGTFPAYAALYLSSDEVGKPIVVFGRGTARGEEVQTGGLLGAQTKGWKWGAVDGVMRWGENSVDSIVTTAGLVGLMPGAQSSDAQMLKLAFNQGGGPNEASLSYGDSGGGLFIESGGVWKLAGINYGADGFYNTAASGPGFGACLYDEGGLYKGSEGNWTLVPDLPSEQATSFYATRISPRAPWIENILATPLPEPDLEVQFAADLAGDFTLDSQALVDAAQKTIRTPISGSQRFYRLRFATQLNIRGIRVENGTIVLNYE